MADLLTVRQAADLCGLTPNAIWNWQHRGHIAPDGLDDRGRPLYSQLTIARAEARTRRRAGHLIIEARVNRLQEFGCRALLVADR